TLVSVWLVLVVRVIYFVALCLLRPHLRFWSWILELIASLGVFLGCILFYFVTKLKVTPTALIGLHYVIMILLLIAMLVSFILTVTSWWQWNQKEPRKSP